MKAKKKLHKLLSMLLALVMVVGLLPTVAYAEGTTIDTVRLTYDASKVILNTAYTEAEGHKMFIDNSSVITNGVKIDNGNSGLYYLEGTSPIDGSPHFRSVGASLNQISASRKYYVAYMVKLENGYDWAAKENNTTSIKFYLNGIETNPVKIDYYNGINKYKVFFELETPSTEPIVKSVSIDQTDVIVQTGGSFNFTATVAGTVTDKTVAWSVSGATSSNTKISAAGVLSVGSNETATTVTVTATSKADSTKSGSREVTITAAPLTIDSVTVSPASKELYTGNTCNFIATVTGTENDKSVTWSVTGQNSATTTITSDGVLTIGSDETADNITVKAVSNADSNKYGEASVTVKQTVFIDEVKLTYDTSKVILNTAYTEAEGHKMFIDNSSVITNGVKIDNGNSGLYYLEGTSPIDGSPHFRSVGASLNQISASRKYYVAYMVKLENGYDWAAKENNTTSIKFYLNGIETNPVKIDYYNGINKYKVFFELETPSTDPIVKSVSIDQTDVSVQAGGSFNFTATVAGTVTDKTVVWSVSGAASSNTKISAAGVLSVGSDETATTVTVTATSKADNSKSASQTVTITAAHTHSLTKVDAKDPTCTEDGNKAYYVCSGCSKWFEDATGSVEITDHSSVVITRLGHNYTQELEDADHLKTAATKCTEHNIYWYDCSRCDSNAKNDTGATDKYFTSATTGSHSFTEEIADEAHYVAGTGTDCQSVKKYYYDCAYCNQIGTTTWDSTTYGEHSYAATWSSDADGHWHECSLCHGKKDEAAHTPGAAATETTPQKCTECDYIITAALGHTHSLTKVEANAPTCTEDGNIEYYTCSGCSKLFADATGNVEITADKTVDKATGHQYEWVIDKEATATEKGSKHEECKVCHDKKAAVEIPATGSSSGGGGVSTYAITVDKTENGTVTISPKSAAKGATVTITVKPDEGFELDTLKVVDKNGDKVKVTEKNGKYTFTMPASKVTVEATFAEIVAAPENPFVDVAESAYYYDAVLWAAENGITGGVDDTHFAPNATCTRAQIVTFLWRAAGSPEPENMSSFADVSADSYYAKAVAWAVENGITDGTGNGMFSPNATCTRAQAMTFLWRAQKSPAADSVNPFTDVAADAYYNNAVLWAAENGITGGTSATTFSPSNDCTRAQIVTFLYRALADK